MQKQFIMLLSVSGYSFVALRRESLKSWQLDALSHLRNGDGKVQLRFQHLKHHRLFLLVGMGQSVQVQCLHTTEILPCRMLLAPLHPKSTENFS